MAASAAPPAAAQEAAGAQHQRQHGADGDERDQQHAQVDLAARAGVPAVAATAGAATVQRVTLAAVAALLAAGRLRCGGGSEVSRGGEWRARRVRAAVWE